MKNTDYDRSLRCPPKAGCRDTGNRDPSNKFSPVHEKGSVVFELLNHLVPAQQERLRDRYPERLSCLEVDHKLEFGWLFHR